MDVSAGSGAARGVASPVQNGRKEWRAVSEHHSSHFQSDGDQDRSKVGQSDERTVYELQKRRENADVDFCSITIDGDVQNDVLQQRLNHVSRQREELQQMEVELGAQVIVRSKIIEIQNRFESQMKEHANNAALLQEQIDVRDQTIQELERKIEEKDREIHALKLDNEAAWAQMGVLREENKELASFRERHNPEAERGQHIQQIHDLEELIKEKERQFLDLQEQQRVAQETIMFKDEQLREVQAWMNRAQELDALHSTTNQSLQAELRDRAEQYNQLWVGWQRQFAEMERLHFSTVQQLQLELTEARERNRTHKEKSTTSHIVTKDASQFGHDNHNELHDASFSDTLNGKSVEYSNGTEGNATHFASVGNASQGEHNLGIPFTPSLLGLSPFLTSAPIAVHPFMIHQQGVPSHVSSHVPQNHACLFHPIQADSSMQHGQQQQYEMPVDRQTLPQHVDAQIGQGIENGATLSTAYEESKDQKPLVNAYPVESQHNMLHISPQSQDTLNLNELDNRKIQEDDVGGSDDHSQKAIESPPKTNTGVDALLSGAPVQPANSKEVAAHSNSNEAVTCASISATQPNLSSVVKTPDSMLLDERLLLACIARTIPASGKISISSTLPNRLAKMLAPLHWHDYKKVFGRLDDFVRGHSDLFVIQGDFIRLKEGAQKKIAATAAAAKLAAAASASSPHYSYLPSVAVTPMSQSYRGNQVRHSNGAHFNVLGSQSETKKMSISVDHSDIDSDGNFSPPEVSMSTTNGANVLGLTNARMPVNFVGRQHGRASGAAPKPQRYLLQE